MLARLASFRTIIVVATALLLLAGVPMSAYGRSPDPRVAYASYWGGSGAEGCEPTVGRDGSIYVTCGTDSPNLPRVGPGSRPYQGQEDGYIAKLDRTGKHIIYATYLGSPGQDEIDSAAVDASGHLYVTGFAADGFPTTPGALDPTFNGAADCCDGLFGDAFVAKLSADGSRLLYSTFLGGSGAERTSSLALGRDGSVTVIGFTGSANFPTTKGAVQSTFGGGSATFEEVPVDAFATKLNPSGSRLVYSTYLGGSGDDVGNGVVLDHGGNAHYTGLSESPDFPTTPGTLKPAYGTPPPELNGFVTKLNAAGRMVWSTYLGGPTRDSAWGIDVDAHRNVYVSGSTIGGFPVTPGAAQPTFGGVRDWFVAKLDRSGASLDWATYLGGSDFDGLSPTLRVDRKGHVDIVGPTASTDFPTTSNAFQATNAGALDLAIVQLNHRGRLLFSSYFGGSGEEDSTGVPPALDRRGNLFISGITTSPDFPVTPGAIQPTYGGGDIDGIVIKVAFRGGP
jgi:Beta-propeller repeat